MMESTKTTSVFVNRAAQTSTRLSHKVPLRLGKDKVAMIHAVTFYMSLPQDGASDHGQLLLLGKSDEESSININDGSVVRFFERPDFIAYAEYRSIFVASGYANMDVGKQFIIPGPGIPVVNDMSLLSNIATTQAVTHRLGCTVYYTEKKVSLEEWASYAKRSNSIASGTMLAPRKTF